jgi:cephalosporin-C deacetylase-like acetyl esterase
MKEMKRILLSVLMLGTAAAAAGSSIGFKFETDHADCRYRLGEEAVFTVTATNGCGEAVKDWHCRVEVDNYGGGNIAVYKKIDFAVDNPFKIKAALDKPGFLRVRVQGRDPAGKWMGKCWAVAYEPEKIRPASERPADFDEFWAKAIEKFNRDVKIDAKMEKDESASKGTHDCYRLTFATVPEGRVIRGQMSVPKGEGPFPVLMNVPGAGSGSWGYIKLNKRIYLTLNVLDYPRVPLGKEDVKALYAEQNRIWGGKTGCGNTWYFEGDLSKGREEYFYYGAILGINRAVDWVAALPFVDRSDFRYAGQSQGGAFGIILAALNRNLTRAQIGEPAVTDISGYLADRRQSGWPLLPEKFRGKPCYENVLKVIPYFDCAHFASSIRIPTRWFVGYTDELCPPHAVWAGYNSLPAGVEKKMLEFPGLGHGIPHGLYREAVKATEASW